MGKKASTHFLKFTGPFRELKRFGLRHQYMYARNYRCWNNYNIRGDYEGDLWIWMKGRDIRLSQVSNEALIYPIIAGKNHGFEMDKPYRHVLGNGSILESEGGYFYPLTYNKKEDKLIQRISYFDYLSSLGFDLKNMNIEEIRGLDNKYMTEYHETYTENSFTKEDFLILKQLYDKGWIELEEIKDKS